VVAKAGLTVYTMYTQNLNSANLAYIRKKNLINNLQILITTGRKKTSSWNQTLNLNKYLQSMMVHVNQHKQPSTANLAAGMSIYTVT